MRLPYSTHSSFSDAIIAALQKQRRRLDGGGPVIVRLSPDGYKGDVTIDIDPTDTETFLTSWEGKDETRFPARIRAAATALRDERCVGSYKIIHDEGVLVIMHVKDRT